MLVSMVRPGLALADVSDFNCPVEETVQVANNETL